MRLLKVLFRYSGGMVVWAVLLGACGGAAGALVLAVINSILGKAQAGLTLQGLWGFAALCLLVPLTRLASGLMLVSLGQRVVLDVRMQLSRQILAAPLRFLERVGSHRLTVALTDDLMAITQAVMVLPVVCINATLVAGSLVYLGWLSPRLLVGILFAIVLGVASYQLPLLASIRRMKRARALQDDLYKEFQALQLGNKELKLHRERRLSFLEGLRGKGESYRHSAITALAILHAAGSWGQLLLFLVIGGTLFTAPQMGIESPETLRGFVLVLLFLLGPLEVLLDAFPHFGRAGVAVRKVEDLGLSLEAEPAADPREPVVPPLRSWHCLQLDGVTHAYHSGGEEGDFLLGPLDLEFAPGEIVFLTGGNGSGKTTLAKLLTGLYTPGSGEVRLDGQIIRPEKLDWYRQHFSAVFVDFFLFDRLFARERVDLDHEASEYLVSLHLQGKVSVENGLLSTTELSQGQRKRLALLTAYLEDRPIYLFDEWAADQDPEFREMFYRQLLPGLQERGKTIFVVTHDDRYFQFADRVIKLEYGRVVSDVRIAQYEQASASET
jgi:putative pyoverdin transport system ATP-binding/permease protein